MGLKSIFTKKRIKERPTATLEKAGPVVSTDTIVLGGNRTKPAANRQIEVDRIAFPTRMWTWCNLFFAYRLQNVKNPKSIRNPRVTLAKYQLLKGRWVRRQNYNVNNIEEAQRAVDFIRKWYPDVE